MLGRCYRLSKDYQFRYIYSKGTSVVSRRLVLIYAKSKRPDSLKIGFSVSNKIGKATVRNRLKRLLRESARANFQRFKQGYNYVFAASAKNPFPKGVSFKEVCAAVEYLLNKMNN